MIGHSTDPLDKARNLVVIKLLYYCNTFTPWLSVLE